MCAPITSPVTNKKRSRSEFPSGKRPVKMLAVQARHFHVANHQVVRFAPRAFQRLAPVEQHVHAHAFVFKHVGDQPRHRGLILDYEHARAHCGPGRCAGNVLRTGKLLRVGIHSVLEFVRLRKSCACDLHLVDKRTLSLSGTSSRFSQGRAPGFLLLALRCRGKFDLE